MIEEMQQYEDLLQQYQEIERKIHARQMLSQSCDFLIAVSDELKAEAWILKQKIAHVVYMGWKWCQEDGLFDI